MSERHTSAPATQTVTHVLRARSNPEVVPQVSREVLGRGSPRDKVKGDFAGRERIRCLKTKPGSRGTRSPGELKHKGWQVGDTGISSERDQSHGTVFAGPQKFQFQPVADTGHWEAIHQANDLVSGIGSKTSLVASRRWSDEAGLGGCYSGPAEMETVG